MVDHIRYVLKNDINGAIVETGCWKGGLGAYMSQFGREVWLFDSFEGLPVLTEDDIDIAKPRGLELNKITGYISVSEEVAKEIAGKLNVHPHIVKGWFSDTLPKYKKEIGPISILRMDGDAYSSTIETLDILYDSVVKGGVIVVDDYYDFSGCRKAIYEFFSKKGITPAIKQYPFARAYFIKE